MIAQQREVRPIPPIGRPESFYAKLAHDADKAGDIHGHEAAKVGQYITLSLDPALGWDEKLKYIKHAIKRHRCKGQQQHRRCTRCCCPGADATVLPLKDQPGSFGCGSWLIDPIWHAGATGATLSVPIISGATISPA